MDTRAILRACDVLSAALPEGSPPLTDSEIYVVCDTCGDLALSSLYLTLKQEMVYTCPTTHEPMVILVRNPDGAHWKRTSRVGEFAIWHAGELHFRGTRLERPDLGLREIRISATRQRRRQKRANSVPST